MRTAKVELEKRVAALEVELARLGVIIKEKGSPNQPGWKKIGGIFEDDPMFEEAMRLGREYRESTRPRTRQGRKV